MPLLLPLLLATMVTNPPLRESRDREPQAIAFAGTRLCLASLAHPGVDSDGRLKLWIADHPDAASESFSYDLARLGEATRHEAECGVEFRQFIELSRGLCTDAEPKALASETALSWRLPSEPATRFKAETPASPSYWDQAEENGCARIVTSPDGQARVWTTVLERVEDGQATRGHAYLQWRTKDGVVVAATAPEELHLDTIIDGIEPLPGGEPLWLITGLRSYVDTYVGDLPRRFAWVLSLGDDGRVRVENAFKGAGPLLLKAKAPHDGKFRHDPLAQRRLVFDRERKRLVLVGIDEKRATTVVARWNGRRFVLAASRFGDVVRADGWAVPAGEDAAR